MGVVRDRVDDGPDGVPLVKLDLVVSEALVQQGHAPLTCEPQFGVTGPTRSDSGQEGDEGGPVDGFFLQIGVAQTPDQGRDIGCGQFQEQVVRGHEARRGSLDHRFQNVCEPVLVRRHGITGGLPGLQVGSHLGSRHGLQVRGAHRAPRTHPRRAVPSEIGMFGFAHLLDDPSVASLPFVVQIPADPGKATGLPMESQLAALLLIARELLVQRRAAPNPTEHEIPLGRVQLREDCP